MKRPNKRIILQLFRELEEATEEHPVTLRRMSKEEQAAYLYMVDRGYLEIVTAKGYLMRDGTVRWQNPVIILGVTASGHDYFTKLRWEWWGKLTFLVFLLAAVVTIVAFFRGPKSDPIKKSSKPAARDAGGNNIIPVNLAVDAESNRLLGETEHSAIPENDAGLDKAVDVLPVEKAVGEHGDNRGDE